jgi:hypothetical protein
LFVFVLFLAAAGDKVYQLIAYGRWFSPGTPTSSTTKTGRHYIAEILLKVALNIHKKVNTLNQLFLVDNVAFVSGLSILIFSLAFLYYFF